MSVAAENASGTMVETTSVGATAIAFAVKLILFLSHHSPSPIGSCNIFAICANDIINVMDRRTCADR
jgi:hypothetical protein